jgi:hypothetical protein
MIPSLARWDGLIEIPEPGFHAERKIANHRGQGHETQAWFLDGGLGVFAPPLAPLGSDLGRPIVKIPAKWYDSSLPRSAIQSIVLRFLYSNRVDHDKPGPDKTGCVSAYRLYQYLRSADLKAVATALTTK